MRKLTQEEDQGIRLILTRKLILAGAEKRALEVATMEYKELKFLWDMLFSNTTHMKDWRNHPLATYEDEVSH